MKGARVMQNGMDGLKTFASQLFPLMGGGALSKFNLRPYGGKRWHVVPDEGDNQTAHGRRILPMLRFFGLKSSERRFSGHVEAHEQRMKASVYPFSASAEAAETSQGQHNFTSIAILRSIALRMTGVGHLERSERSQSRCNVKEILQLKPQNDCKMRGDVCKSSRKLAFTLAEVLITLGIIGVVAAMTIPTLISNYKKHEIAIRLEQNYNIIQNALQMAQVEYGDMSTWEVPFNKMDLSFFETYLFPNLKLLKKGKYSLRDLGYTTPVYQKDGKIVSLSLDAISTKAVMNNGSVLIRFATITGTNSKKEEVCFALAMFVDLNGPKGPNIEGRDVFQYELPLADGAKLDIGLTHWTIYLDSGKIIYKEPYTHEELLESCKKNTDSAVMCGALIAENGWKVPDDYPFRF